MASQAALTELVRARLRADHPQAKFLIEEALASISAPVWDALLAVINDREEELLNAPWEYGFTAAAFPEDNPSTCANLDEARDVRDHTATDHKRWTHGSPVTIHRRRAAGEWEVFDDVT